MSIIYQLKHNGHFAHYNMHAGDIAKIIHFDFNMRLLTALFIIISLLLTPPQLHADMATANRAYENGDFKTAFGEFTKLANEKNATAQHNLAFMCYGGGEGTEQNYTKVFFWLGKAAKSGYASTQDILAYMYSHGLGVRVDRVRAYVWHSFAASNGIFLASEVRDGLENEMGQAELSQARILTREYLKKYSKPPS